ncbi:unnamed protein product [Leptidea sinapis]|uniref:Serpin domain-containing protein n=1 Tax=Leptidea sinapis TaxID=189913 RepID=A0A5E4Q7S7_9NEOP|nr:unnamed protein product [Leptidea sinapis]
MKFLALVFLLTVYYVQCRTTNTRNLHIASNNSQTEKISIDTDPQNKVKTEQMNAEVADSMSTLGPGKKQMVNSEDQKDKEFYIQPYTFQDILSGQADIWYSSINSMTMQSSDDAIKML